ncbi:hypothetical protein JTB14_035086 [Gonioctena quinquepunctata]|nr:hypothetical protein JTB14_035086 [Gonioctena quinquepunctata]
MVQEGQMSSFATPQEKRPNRQTKVCLDGFEKSQLRNVINNFHVTEKCVPTLKKLHYKFCDEFGYLGGRETLREEIHKIGFSWKEIKKDRKILLECHSIRHLRLEFLRKMK